MALSGGSYSSSEAPGKFREKGSKGKVRAPSLFDFFDGPDLVIKN